MIEVKHDWLSLPIKRRIRVTNARRCEEYIHAKLESNFNRGLKIRFVPDYQCNVVELGSRRSLNVDMVLAAIKAGGFYVETLTWATNKLRFKGQKHSYEFLGK